MSDEEVKKLYGIIQQYSPDMADDFLSADDQQAWFNENSRMLESLHGFTDKYKNTSQLKTDRLKGLSELYEQQGVYQDNEGNVMLPTEERIASFRKEYPGIGEDEIIDWFNKSNEYKKFYEAEAEKELQKNLRKKEVKEDLGFLDNFLTSDYSKQRYIDDPNASIIGKQGKFNPLSRQGAEELMDVGLGIAGAVGDAIPGLGPSFLGPAARAVRDVAHIAYDSPYRKDWTQIGIDIGKDVGTNLGAALLFNARTGARLASNAADKDVKYALEAARETEHIKSGLPQVAEHMHIPSKSEIEFYRAANLPYPSSDRVLRNTIKDMPDSELKNELVKEVFTEAGRPINRKEVQRIYQKYLTQTQPGMRETVRLADDYMRPMAKVGNEPVTQYLRNVADAKTFSELSKYQKAQYLANQAAMAINSGKVGQVAVQELATGHGRGANPKLIETALRKKEFDERINNVISTYSSLWSKTKKPLSYESNPIIKEAWDKWSKQ